ncbi:MAG: hypothetical protein J0H49_02875 [Acidobacteria bacterium]|nr:hypothetical protein [Acidobacteriota bacterium]
MRESKGEASRPNDLKSQGVSSLRSNDLTEVDLRVAVGNSSLSDTLWKQFVGPEQRHATLTRWADALTPYEGMQPIVGLLRAHSLLKQRRFREATEAFQEARSNSSFFPSDYLALAAALRGVGSHMKAIEALAGGDHFATTPECIYWRAVSLLALGREHEAIAALSTIDAVTRDAKTSWLIAYLSSALRNPPVAVSPAISQRYSAIDAGDASDLIFAVLDYKSPDLSATSSNVGDYIQTLSLIRHLARFCGPRWSFSDPELARIVAEMSRSWAPAELREVSRHVHITTLDRDVTWPVRTLYHHRQVWCILHGWYHQWNFGFGSPFPPPTNLKALILSFHLHEYRSLNNETIAFLRLHQPIGCRDWSTTDWLLNAGVDAFFSGCLTSTLLLPPGIHDGGDVLYVDAVPPADDHAVEQISHERQQIRDDSFLNNIEEALKLVRLYSCSPHVTTSRLHAYLPCRALGTPVAFQPRNPSNRRFDGLDELDESGLGVMRNRIATLLNDILFSVLTGESEDDTRARWAQATGPWVAEARHRLASAPRFFDPAMERAAEPVWPKVATHKSKVTVVLAFDRGYVRHVPPLMRSIRQMASAQVQFVFLIRGLGTGDLDTLVHLAENRVRIFPMDSYLRNTLVRLAGATSISTMDRLFLPHLLPEDDRVVYLDIDAVCLGDLAELLDQEPSACGITARPNPAPQLRLQSDIVEQCARSLDSNAARRFRRQSAADVELSRPCFNAGVLVLSLARLRALNFTQTTVGLVEEFGIQDEQALNIFSRGRFRELECEWNAMPYFDPFDGAKLIHWAGPTKPWLARPVRFAEVWERFGGEKNTDDDPESVGYWGNREHYSSSWEGRNRAAAALIPPGATVLDLGCGRMSLRRFLPSGCQYFPADLPKWSAEVIRVDLDAGEFPPGRYDYVVLLGVLEYLTNPAAVVAAAADHTRTLIAGYSHPGPQSVISQRRNALWINDFYVDDLRALFRSTGWTIRSLQVYKNTPTEREVIYVLER